MQYLNKSHSSCIWSLFVGELVSYLRYLCLFVHSGVQHILCCIFLRLVYTMLPVSLCFSSSCVHYVASFSGLCFFSLPLRLCVTFIFTGFFSYQGKIRFDYRNLSTNIQQFEKFLSTQDTIRESLTFIKLVLFSNKLTRDMCF